MAYKHLSKSFLALNPSKDLKNTLQIVMLEAFDNTCIKVREKLMKTFRRSYEKLKNSQKIQPHSSIDIKSLRREYLENFETKLVENKIFASKLIKEQKERELRKKMREEANRQKHLEDIQQEEKIKEVELSLQKKKQEEKIDLLKKRSERRKNENEYYRNALNSKHQTSFSAAPLYKQIEEDFKYKFEMPELDRRKKELQQKREFAKPISLSEIREHSRKIENLLQEIREKKENSRIIDDKDFISNHKSKFTRSILEEERKKREEELKKEQEVKIRYEKKKKYAQIVGEMYQPTIDKFKQQEMKLIKARLQFPVKLRSSALISKAESSSDYARSVSVQPRKWKKNSMIPEQPTKRPEKKIFYLEEMRKKRDNSLEISKNIMNWQDRLEDFSNEEEKLEFLKKKALNFEKAAKRYENQLGNKNLDIDVAEHVNDLIINSIKAKLVYLE